MGEKAPRVGRWLRHLFWKVEGVRETTDFRAMREGYSGRISDGRMEDVEMFVEPWTEEDEVWRVERAGV